MRKFSREVMRILAVATLMTLACSVTAQQAYPSKPIRFISPNPPGGGNTLMARLVGQQLSESWGQQVIVDNRPGGNGFIGGEALAKSPPDGYTIMMMANTHIITPLLFAAPYDPIKDFAPVATIAKTECVLVLHSSVPASTLREFIAYAKSRPGQLNYGSSGAGSITRLAGALFDTMAGTRMQNISYKGTGQAMADLLGGQVQLFFSVPSTATPHVTAGKIKAIAVTGDSRSSALPMVPTFAEAGLPGFAASTWYGILAPAGTPQTVLSKLSTEIARMLTLPDLREKIASQGAEPFASTREQFAAMMKAETTRYAKVIQVANIKADE